MVKKTSLVKRATPATRARTTTTQVNRYNSLCTRDGGCVVASRDEREGGRSALRFKRLFMRRYVLCPLPSFIARKQHRLSFQSDRFSHRMYFSVSIENLHIRLATSLRGTTLFSLMVSSTSPLHSEETLKHIL